MEVIARRGQLDGRWALAAGYGCPLPQQVFQAYGLPKAEDGRLGQVRAVRPGRR